MSFCFLGTFLLALRTAVVESRPGPPSRVPYVRAGLMVALVGCGGLGTRTPNPEPIVSAVDAPVADGGAPAASACAQKWLLYAGGGPAQCQVGDAGTSLCGAPLASSPTADGFGLSVVLASGDPSALSASVRVAGTSAWSAPLPASVRSPDTAEWRVAGLRPGVRYDYEIRLMESDAAPPLYTGSAVTARPAGETFTFALLSDTHVGTDPDDLNQGDWCALAAIAGKVDALAPDFVMNLGDMLDFHKYGFNEAPPDPALLATAYRNYRALLGDTLGHAAHFAVVGNWDGENGYEPPDTLAASRDTRRTYVPGPLPTTYPQGASPYADYYAFTWGDALFVALNVMTYTTTPHLLAANPGLPDDWTLGAEQMAWLETTLANATAKWRFVFVHHAVGGAAADANDSAYGRGGGQAAHVGEQARVHDLMVRYGVQIFFYGHDHVFTDLVVDGIHYAEPGSAGAIWLFSSAVTGYETSWLTSGFGQVTVSPSTVDVRFVAIDGRLLYGFTLGL